ncbi:Alpha/Beta hydrolase protein [Lactifluus volemus]|nr:Alpha/Beta hydrolase protein [Lactifluus volemus]
MRMRFFLASLVDLCALISITLAFPGYGGAPTVQLDSGTFLGTAFNGTNEFLGIPYAQPPVGDLRFRRPQALGPYTGTYHASLFGSPCPQQTSPPATFPSGFPNATLQYLQSLSAISPIPDSEDCLTINVIAPANIGPDAKLPVVVWMYGGGFERGSADVLNGSAIVARSVDLNEPVIYVSMNYRVSLFGFLASQEVKDAGVGNLGLRDQRLALEWVQKYICAFGGDPTKVLIWGESAGAISAALHMVTNNGNPEGLFRGAFMQSGSPPSTGDITLGQPFYDDLVNSTGCSGSSDTLSCLRTVPYATLKAAMDATPSFLGFRSLSLVWKPRVDGDFICDNPVNLVLQGQVADIPFITGDCDDEGTAFSLSPANLTTTEELGAYLTAFYFQNPSSDEIDNLLALYPQNDTLGSPFDTGDKNALAPQFKRMAALLGDKEFQSVRRFFLSQRSGSQKTYSYLSKRLKSLPFIGAAHGSDLLFTYGPGELMDYLIHFATNLDPNGGSSPWWPQYTTVSPDLMTFLPTAGTNITQDTYRAEGIQFVTELSRSRPV